MKMVYWRKGLRARLTVTGAVLTLALGAAVLGSLPIATPQATASVSESNAQQKLVTTPEESTVVMIPEASLDDCPAGYVCLFEHENFNNDKRGRMLKWSDPGTRIPHLSRHDFNDEMSSWANKSRYDAKWYRDWGFNGNLSGGACMNAGEKSLAVGPNDEASSFAIFTDGRAC